MFEAILKAILPYILEIILAIISLVVSYYVIPYIKNDFIPWLKEKRLYNAVMKFVRAAEKLAESGAIQKVDKKAKVVELLKKKGFIVDSVTEAFIESCVKELDEISSLLLNEFTETEVEQIEE